jgi:osmotically-inducible protein OsmY
MAKIKVRIPVTTWRKETEEPVEQPTGLGASLLRGLRGEQTSATTTESTPKGLSNTLLRSLRGDQPEIEVEESQPGLTAALVRALRGGQAEVKVEESPKTGGVLARALKTTQGRAEAEETVERRSGSLLRSLRGEKSAGQAEQKQNKERDKAAQTRENLRAEARARAEAERNLKAEARARARAEREAQAAKEARDTARVKLKKVAPEAEAGSPSTLRKLGVLTAIGTGVGVLVAPTTRKAIVGWASKYIRTTDQAKSTEGYASGSLSTRAQELRERMRREARPDDSPQTIEDRVQTEFGEDAELRSQPRLSVNVEPGGIVYLRGAMPSVVLRERAEQVARRALGVKDVINEISVLRPGEDLSDHGANDDALSLLVAERLRQDEAFKGVLLKVDSQSSGAVFLRGTVQSESHRELAETLARQVEGVTTVVNDLAVVSPGPDIAGEDRGANPIQ